MIFHGYLSLPEGKQATIYIDDFPNVEDFSLYIWLVVWNMAFITFHSVGNVIIPTDELIFVRGVETTNPIYIYISIYIYI